MKKIKTYDLPTRLFHWIFAGLFAGAFAIAKLVDDESPIYSYHMLLGLTLSVTVVLRIFWGFVGSRYARFSSFALHPIDLLKYFGQLLSGATQRVAGHNPASSWAALIMMGLALGLAVTGTLMSSGGNKEVLEEVHELFANAFLIVAILHVAGVVFHSLRYRDWIGLSMINGKKMALGDEDSQIGIPHSHRGAALLFLALLGVFVFELARSYDSNAQTLQLFGATLQLGEAESGERGEGIGAHEHHRKEVGEDE